MEKAAFIIYLIVLVISPLLFGAVHTYAYTLVFSGILIAGVLLLRENIKKDLRTGAYHYCFLKNSLNPLFFLFLFFLFLQTVPLPGSVARFLSPEAWDVGTMSMPASGGRAAALDTLANFATHRDPAIMYTDDELPVVQHHPALCSLPHAQLPYTLCLPLVEKQFGNLERFSVFQTCERALSAEWARAPLGVRLDHLRWHRRTSCQTRYRSFNRLQNHPSTEIYTDCLFRLNINKKTIIDTRLI